MDGSGDDSSGDCETVTCLNTCLFAGDGQCDDGGTGSDFGLCQLGTDCQDCGRRCSQAEEVIHDFEAIFGSMTIREGERATIATSLGMDVVVIAYAGGHTVNTLVQKNKVILWIDELSFATTVSYLIVSEGSHTASAMSWQAGRHRVTKQDYFDGSLRIPFDVPESIILVSARRADDVSLVKVETSSFDVQLGQDIFPGDDIHWMAFPVGRHIVSSSSGDVEVVADLAWLQSGNRHAFPLAYVPQPSMFVAPQSSPPPGLDIKLNKMSHQVVVALDSEDGSGDGSGEDELAGNFISVLSLGLMTNSGQSTPPLPSTTTATTTATTTPTTTPQNPDAEFGSILITGSWAKVRLSESWENPVVIVSPASSRDPTPGTIEVAEVQSSSFLLRFRNWDNSFHQFERVSYMVVEAGFHDSGSVQWEAGSKYIGPGSQLKANVVGFDHIYTATPIILTSVGVVSSVQVCTRMLGISRAAFHVGLQRQEIVKKSKHSGGVVHWVAFPSDAQGEIRTTEGIMEVQAIRNLLRHEPSTFHWSGLRIHHAYAAMQSTYGRDTATIRVASSTSTSIEMYLSEDTSKDKEVSHTQEQVGIVVFAAGE